MGFKIVKPDEPSQTEMAVPDLPREEAQRLRRKSRSYMDRLLPEAIRVIQDALLSEDMDDRKWAADKVLKATLAAVPNETIDPESAVVDGSAKPSEALEALEKETENGSGNDEDS